MNINVKGAMALLASCARLIGERSDKMTESGVPKRDGHREKTKQRIKKYGEKFRPMMRIFGTAKLPKGLRAPGFHSYTKVHGRTYLIQHGTHYRLDRLLARGLVSFAPAS